MLGEKIKEGNGIVMVGRDTEENDICMFIFPNKNFIGEEVVIKMKSKNYTTEVEGFAIDKNLLFKNSEAKAIYRAFRDSSIVKFNFKGTPFSVSGIGFTKLYKEAYWKDFDLEKPSYKPPKGEKVYSLVEGEGYLEAEDAIWD
ncbi:MAG: hypothetical protein ACK5NU_03730 [Fusobacterium ulcerans]|uniref:hypothetical protein n=1 Tax=Fusobacterium ulcerans TaxID=861 RepID=UPI003A85235B